MPAAWLASHHPATVVLTRASPRSSALRDSDLATHAHTAIDVRTEHGRYLALSAADGVHRVILPSSCENVPLSYLVHADDHFGLRTAAIQRFQAMINGRCGDRGARLDAPSRHQSARLATMLRILDALDCPADHQPSLRQIAGAILYPGREFPRSVEWKSLSERRQTSRLVREAVRMRDIGYRSLLTARNTQR